MLFCSQRTQTVRARTACHIWELKVKDLEPLLFTYPWLKDSLAEGYRLHMVQTLARPSESMSTTEANVEAELGVNVTESDAHDFKSQLETVRALYICKGCCWVHGLTSRDCLFS